MAIMLGLVGEGLPASASSSTQVIIPTVLETALIALRAAAAAAVGSSPSGSESMLLQPPQPRREPEPDGTKLALRAATLGIVALLLFGVLVFRLWALQVLRSAEYVAQANVQNDVREIPIPPQRGDIVDRNGVTLVENTSAVVLQVDPSTISRSIDCAVDGRPGGHLQHADGRAPVGAVPRCRQLPQQPRCFELARLARVLKKPDREGLADVRAAAAERRRGGAVRRSTPGRRSRWASAKDAQVATCWSAATATRASASCAPTSAATRRGPRWRQRARLRRRHHAGRAEGSAVQGPAD